MQPPSIGSRTRYLPDAERLSVLAATIVLAYALTRFVELPGQEFSVQFPGIYVTVALNVRTVIALLVAGLTAMGTDWLLRDHPQFNEQSTIQHSILPALTAWVIGIPLAQLSFGPIWWIGLSLGGILLILILTAEYITVDSEDIRHPIAAAGLTAISFALFLILATTLRSAGGRLYVILPAVAISTGLVCLRTLHLRLHGEWTVIEAGVVALVIGQLAAAFHYWPIAPIPYGLMLLGPSYALTSLIGGLAEDHPLRQALIEPGLALLLTWGTAWLLR